MTYDWPFPADRPDRARVRVAFAQPVESSLNGGDEYYAFELLLSHQKTVGSPSCLGCLQGVTITLDQVTLMQRPGIGDYVISAPLVRNFISWQVPVASISDSVVVVEGNSGTVPSTFVVGLAAGSSSDTVRVNYATQDGTATAAGGDYVATSGTLTFLPGETSKTITVSINGDLALEDNETFYVNLSNVAIANGRAMGVIRNDEHPSISIGDGSTPEGNSGPTSFPFTVTLSNPTIDTVTVHYQTAAGTATAGTDYQEKNGTLSITPQSISIPVVVAVNGDVVPEPDETFYINLSSPTNATIADGQGLGTILSDDCLLYRDGDGDGYGDPSVSGVPGLCGPATPGYAPNNTDCDDTDPNVHPGAPDNTCNGIDDNCNGSTDDGISCVCIEHAPGLVGWWKGEGNATDATANHNDGTPRNGAGFAAGKVGTAFNLDGVDDYVANLGVASTFSFIENTGIFTIEAWIQLSNPNAVAEQAITANTFTSADRGHSFFVENLHNEHELYLFLSKGLNGTPIINSHSPNGLLSAPGWHHVAATGNGSNVTFYVDGVPYPGTGSMGSLGSGDAIRAVDVGWDSDQARFGGQIDELAIYDRALSASEMRAIYNSGSNGMCGLGNVGVDGPGSGRGAFAFVGPWPNPASRAVNLEFQIPDPGVVRAEVVDVQGRRVAGLLENEPMTAGSHRLQWDGRDESQRKVTPGIYLVRISMGPDVAVRRIIVIR